MNSDSSAREKVAWVFVQAGQVLVTRNHGRDLFYFPGGHRELGESDAETLVREIDEELQTAIDPATMVHVGTYETPTSDPARPIFRMICYTADHDGPLTPSQEIAEKAWFGYQDRDRVSPADQLVFDTLHADGRLS
jgi:8-oxo-dGTP pyrophosphatase MutT (NUDIX family)